MSDEKTPRHLAELEQIFDSVETGLVAARSWSRKYESLAGSDTAPLQSAADRFVGELSKLKNQASTSSNEDTFTNTILSQPSILLVEDNTVNRLVAEGMLQNIRCHIDIAVNGQEAVDKFSESDYDIIFMDCQMPVMDGFAATSEIRDIESREKKKRTPIVALTANALKGDRERCMSAGMDDYVSKPFTIADLKAAIEQQLGSDITSSMRIPKFDQFENEEESRDSEDESPKSEGDQTIDYAVLDSIRGLQQTNGDELLNRIINVFLKSSPVLLDDLLTSLDSGAAEDVANRAHALRSSCASVGAVMIAECCQKVEERARSDHSADFSQFVDKINDSYRQARARLRLIVSEKAA
jgi:CheY-like chemotaxis protein/HPt (histidine-containing phosphotransfer) domain-containing protein